MNENQLKQLIREKKATILYIHGTARSGSTIAEVIFAQVADRAIHQPFAGLHHELGGTLRTNKLPFDEDVYEAGCGLIVQTILEILKQQNHVTLLVKEVSRFFSPEIWSKWIQIPEKFLFIIREPHLQYLSWLSYVTDVVSKTNGSLMNDPATVLEKAREIETVNVQTLKPAWSGTTISYNFQEWESLIRDWDMLQRGMERNSKQIAVLDLIALRHHPDVAIAKTLNTLGFQVNESHNYSRNLRASQEKIFDFRDINRPQVRKARNSHEITALELGETVDTLVFPPLSQDHILRLIPLYLKLLYADENAALPSMEQLKAPGQSQVSFTLGDIHPLIAYAIARFHQQKNPSPEVEDYLHCLVNGKTKTVVGEEKPNSVFAASFAQVDAYWQKIK